ncbi:immunity 49 family protein [Streptomyces sp. ISL-98]|uniref:immunity 49 family protein n=1 Tax=Streptomyces sp. ISL-98 TaxID=2819192 RepID=UPI001BE87DDF|nr:immunity 49 family protein [Streptomyces sp. ISL-98]MBT2504792.1 immunity 49 family protein [Streptomyces sp. ISL-98]
MQIPRHEFPTRNLVGILESRTEYFWEDVEELRTQPGWFAKLPADAINLFARRCVLDPESDKLETWEACVIAMQVSSALFASAQATTDSIECRIGDEMRTVRAGTLQWAHAGKWLNAFWLACICREKKRLNELCQFPVARLREADGVFDEYIYNWVEALQAYWLKRPDFGDKLVAAVDGTDPEVLRHAPRDGVLKIMYPPMNLLTQLARGDEEKFNTELAKALEWHKSYWTRDEDRALTAEGLIALGPLGVTCLAVQAGFTITVESEYLPKHLVAGAWINEFPT